MIIRPVAPLELMLNIHNAHTNAFGGHMFLWNRDSFQYEEKVVTPEVAAEIEAAFDDASEFDALINDGDKFRAAGMGVIL